MTSLEAGAFAPHDASRFPMTDVTVPDKLFPQKVTTDTQVLTPVQEFSVRPLSLEIPFVRTQAEFDSPGRHRKDPSFYLTPDGKAVLYISENDSDTQSGWRQVAYVGDNLKTPLWKKLGVVDFKGVDPKFVDSLGDEVERTLCAAGAFPNGEGLVVQDLCFHDGGNIHVFKGSDPTNLEYKGVAVRSAPERGIAGIYDPEPVRGLGPNGGVINQDTGEEEFFLTLSTVGSYRMRINDEGRREYFPQEGSISLAKRSGGWIGEYQILDRPILTELQVPGHIPTILNGEWVLEGGQSSEVPKNASEYTLIHQSTAEDGRWRINTATFQMTDLWNLMEQRGAGNRFLHYLTAFIEGPRGSRQRGVLASSNRLEETPTVLGFLDPERASGDFRETGHGAALVTLAA